MDDAEREAANRMIEEEDARLRKYFKRRLARLQEWEKRHEQVIELIRQHREARFNAQPGE